MNFYLKKSESESNLIMGVIYDAQFHDGRFVFSTQERIEPKNWLQPKKGSGKPKKGHEDLTERLLDISKQATSYLRLNRAHLTKDGLKAHIESLRPTEIAKPKEESLQTFKSMAEIWHEWLLSIKDTVSDQTYKGYYNSLDVLKTGRKGRRKNAVNFMAFIIEKKWIEITPDKFTATHYNLYLGYLKKNAKPNTVAKRLKHFKAFILHLIDDLKIGVGFDVNKIKYKETAGLKISLSEEQLQGYIDAEITESTLSDIRDLWVCQCSLGPRISDFRRIDKNIRGNKIILETKKNRKPIEIPIPPRVKKILEKNNYVLPKVSEQHYRRGIKKLHKMLFPEDMIQIREGNEFEDIPVFEEISSHDAVRTFITLSHERGMSVNSLAKITGKTVKVILSNYLVESQKVAEKEFEKAWGNSHL